MDKSKSIPRIHTRYKQFQKDQRDIWESFCLIEFYGPKIQDAIKKNILPPLTIDRVWNTTGKTLKKDDTYGAISSLTRKGNYRRTLLEIVLVFEDYMSDLIKDVYLDIPNKLSSNQGGDSESGRQKIIKMILESTNKEEIIERLVEEKIRGVFYGNPLDVFEKDKAKLEFSTFFKDEYPEELKEFRKIVAARNIVAHNNGKIDRKYQREADPKARLGKKLAIDREFLKNSIYILSLLAAQATRMVVERIYKEKPSGNLGKAISEFKKEKC